MSNTCISSRGGEGTLDRRLEFQRGANQTCGENRASDFAAAALFTNPAADRGRDAPLLQEARDRCDRLFTDGLWSVDGSNAPRKGRRSASGRFPQPQSGISRAAAFEKHRTCRAVAQGWYTARPDARRSSYCVGAGEPGSDRGDCRRAKWQASRGRDARWRIETDT